LVLFGTVSALYAEENDLKFDGAFHLSGLNLKSSIGEGTLGVGGRFGYRLSSFLFLDAGALYFPEDASGNYGEKLILGGIRVGKQFDGIGLFGKARSGVISFEGKTASLRNYDGVYPAIDIGIMLEWSRSKTWHGRGKNLFVRVDVGDCIIFFNDTVKLEEPTISGVKTLGTSHSPLVEFGIGVRF